MRIGMLSPRKRFSQMLRSDSGTIVPLFGLLSFVLIAFGALAIDYSRALRTKWQVHSALDAAALATAKAIRLANLTDGELEQLAKTYFESNFPELEAGQARYDDLELKIDREAASASVSVKVELPTTLGAVLGEDLFHFDVGTTAIYGAQDIELSMMLDVSGSMSGGKVSDLRNAARDLIEIIIPKDRPPTANNRIAIAPYSSSVNAGEFAEVVTGKASPNRCVSERPGRFAATDDAPLRGPLGKKATNCPPNSVVPLTSEPEQLTKQIDLITAGGSTAGHLGIAWAWYLVSPNWASIFPEASKPKDYNDRKTLKAVIIMTDGEFNTEYEGGNGSSSVQAEALCKNINASGVLVFAVAFEAPPAALATISKCASSPKYVYDARDGGELRDAFRQIAEQLKQLRVTS